MSAEMYYCLLLCLCIVDIMKVAPVSAKHADHSMVPPARYHRPASTSHHTDVTHRAVGSGRHGDVHSSKNDVIVKQPSAPLVRLKRVRRENAAEMSHVVLPSVVPDVRGDAIKSPMYASTVSRESGKQSQYRVAAAPGGKVLDQTNIPSASVERHGNSNRQEIGRPTAFRGNAKKQRRRPGFSKVLADKRLEAAHVQRIVETSALKSKAHNTRKMTKKAPHKRSKVHTRTSRNIPNSFDESRRSAGLKAPKRSQQHRKRNAGDVNQSSRGNREPGTSYSRDDWKHQRPASAATTGLAQSAAAVPHWETGNTRPYQQWKHSDNPYRSIEPEIASRRYSPAVSPSVGARRTRAVAGGDGGKMERRVARRQTAKRNRRTGNDDTRLYHHQQLLSLRKRQTSNKAWKNRTMTKRSAKTTSSRRPKRYTRATWQ